MNAIKAKEAFTVESKHDAFYTGGNIQWSTDGEHLHCQNGAIITIVSVEKGIVLTRLGETKKGEEEVDTINTFRVSNDSEQLVAHHKSGLFKLWSLKEGKVTKSWKAIHNGPVPQIALFGNDLMASGGSDGNVRLWDLKHNACTHNLRGSQGVISVLEFYSDETKHLVFAAGDNTKICGWNTETGQLKIQLSGHFSKITSLSFHNDGVHLVSSGRDKVLILWDMIKQTSLRTLPVYEAIEGTFILPTGIKVPVEIDLNDQSKIYVASAGEKGIVKLWEMKSGLLIYTQENSLVPQATDEGGLSITHLFYNSQQNSFAVVSVDHNIIIHSLETFKCTKQFVGYSDEILDIVYVGDNGSHIAVATNSTDIKLYDLSTMSCQLLRGHSDLVLALAVSPSNCNLMISSAKDNSVRVWLMSEKSKKMSCIGSATRHTASVGSVSISSATTTFFVSVSQDSCLKLWPLPENLSTKKNNITLNATHTVVAHEKDINNVTVSPNDQLIATGSQDKTAKLWSAENLKSLGVLRGHRRGVWCVRFSPIDQVLLTTSADCTLKLWSLTELNCLKTFEGHESSVLRVEFISRGMQLITSSADGLIKVWSVKTSECVTTLAEHESRVLALAVSKDESHAVSGGSDSMLIIWRDVTVENQLKSIAEKEQMILEEQKLANLLKSNELVDALKLALKLEKPFHALKIIETIIKRSDNGLMEAVRELKKVHKEALLKCVSTWNTNSRNSHAAQLVIKALLKDIDSGDLQVNSLASLLEALIPYTDRHYKRLTLLQRDLHFLKYTVSQIKPHREAVAMNVE